MENLSKLLERFSKILNRDALTKEIILKTIEVRTGVIIPPENISLKEGMLTIEASPVVKNEVSLREESVKTELEEVHNIKVSRILYK